MLRIVTSIGDSVESAAMNVSELFNAIEGDKRIISIDTVNPRVGLCEIVIWFESVDISNDLPMQQPPKRQFIGMPRGADPMNP